MNDLAVIENATIEDESVDWYLFYDLYKDRPVMFMYDILGFKCDPWQQQATTGIMKHKYSSIPSGQGVGKTALLACLIIHFFAFNHRCRIVATAPTMQQLNDVLWPEISKWLRGTVLDGVIKWSKTKITMAGDVDNWFGVTRTATKAENMQGYHEDNMLYVVDESSGVADAIFEAIYGTLAKDNNKLVMIGNPNKRYGAFYESFTTDRARFYVQRVSARDSSRTSKETIQMLEDKYGIDSNVVRVRVDGLPPSNEDDVFIPIELIEGAIHADCTPHIPGEVNIMQVGCDVARFGSDKTIFAPRVDMEIQKLIKYQGNDLMTTTENLVFLGEMMRQKYKFEGIVAFKIDDTGVGGGVTDRLRQKQKNYPEQYSWYKVVPLHFGTKVKHKYYDDTTTWMMGLLKNMISPYDVDGNKQEILKLPDDPDLVGQGSGRKYYLTDRSKQKVESKKEMKKRGVSSPDELDAVLLAVVPVKEDK